MKIEHAYILYIDNPEATNYMEQCKQSCIDHNVPVTPFLGFKLPTTVAEVKEKWGVRIDPIVQERIEEPVFRIWFKEQLCTSGHIAMWKEIAKQDKAYAIFEHDAIVKRDFYDVEVNDGEIVFLGYRVDHRDDYECINDPFTKIPVNKFEGTHAYAITPNTCRYLLEAIEQREYLPVGISVDFYLGVQNLFKLNMFVADPAPVIAAVEDKVSETQPEGKVAKYNMLPPDGFLKGLVKPEKYSIDEKNNWLVF